MREERVCALRHTDTHTHNLVLLLLWGLLWAEYFTRPLTLTIPTKARILTLTLSMTLTLTQTQP